jgi:transglutaminase-like putative cysteine protease
VETRRILVGCDFRYAAVISTPVIFQVQPAGSPLVAVEDARWASEPAIAVRGYSDLYGNPCARAVLPAGRSSFRYQAVAVVPDAAEDADEDAPECAPDALPDQTLIYTLPSRYCLPDVLGGEAWSRFGGLAPGYRRVQAICDHVHSHLAFQYGSTTALSSAADVNLARRGVCRDFTHLAISFCRALNIPAR